MKYKLTAVPNTEPLCFPTLEKAMEYLQTEQPNPAAKERNTVEIANPFQEILDAIRRIGHNGDSVSKDWYAASRHCEMAVEEILQRHNIQLTEV